jgi:mono/diheme cytochrome c family protein
VKRKTWLLVLATALACSDSSAPPAPAPAPPAAEAPAAPSPAPAPAPAPVAGQPDAARGKPHFETLCISCHGPRGDGDGPAGLALAPRPAHLGDRAFMADKSDDYLFGVIKNGGASVGKSPLMVAWGGTLTDAQIRDVVAYVRTLAH